MATSNSPTFGQCWRRQPGPDAADALGLGLAITHAHKAMARLALADGVIGAGKGKYKAGRSR